MRIEYLEECVDLAETLSFTETAKRLHLSQSVLSKHIAKLEEEIGLKLFERGPSGVSVVGKSAWFIQGAREVVAPYRVLRADLERRRGDSETVAVGYLVGAVGRFIPAAHGAYTRLDYRTDLRYYTYEFTDILPALERGDVDVAVTTCSESILDSSEYDHVVLFEDGCLLAVSRDHPLAARARVSPRDLRGETLRVSSDSEWTRELMEYLHPNDNGIMVERDVRDMHALPVLLTVENCVGLAPAHLRDYYRETYGDRFAFLEPEGFSARIVVAAVWKKSNPKKALPIYAEILREVVRG